MAILLKKDEIKGPEAADQLLDHIKLLLHLRMSQGDMEEGEHDGEEISEEEMAELEKSSEEYGKAEYWDARYTKYEQFETI